MSELGSLVKIREAEGVWGLQSQWAMKFLDPRMGLALGCVFVFACGAAHADEPQDPNPEGPSHKHNTAEVSEGGADYVAHCAKCHGATGRGTDDGPAVVGEGALPKDPPPAAKVRTTKFETAADVFDFMKAHMPADKPGSLSDNQYYAILAFDLKLNGVDLGNKKVDPTTASTIRLPGR